MPIRSFAGKVGSTLAKINGSDQPGSGTATLWYFNGSAYVASTITVDVKNFTETDITSGKLHKFTLTNGVWAADALGGESQEHEEIEFLTSWRIDGTTKSFQVKTRTAKVVEPSEESEWTDVHMGIDCDEEE